MHCGIFPPKPPLPVRRHFEFFGVKICYRPPFTVIRRQSSALLLRRKPEVGESRGIPHTLHFALSTPYIAHSHGRRHLGSNDFRFRSRMRTGHFPAKTSAVTGIFGNPVGIPMVSASVRRLDRSTVTIYSNSGDSQGRVPACRISKVAT